METNTVTYSELSPNVFHKHSECHSPGENSERDTGATQQQNLELDCPCPAVFPATENPETKEDFGENMAKYGGSTASLVGKVHNLDLVFEKESFKVVTVHDLVTNGIGEKHLARNMLGLDGNQESENPGNRTRKERVQEVQLCAATEADSKEVFERSAELFRKEADPERFLEMKKKSLLEELEAMLVPEDEIHVEKVNNSSCSGKIVDNCSMMMQIDEERIFDQQNDTENIHVLRGSNVSLRNSLKIEVIDETALLEPIHVSKNGIREEIGIFCPPRSMQINCNKYAATEMGGKKNRRSRRRARDAKILELKEKFGNANNFDKVNGNHKNEAVNKITYLREEMEALRSVNVAEQRELWKAIYKTLMPDVAREYSSLTSSNHQKKMGSSSDRTQHPVKREETPTIIGETYSESLDGEREKMEGDNEIKIMGSLDPCCSLSVSEGGNTALEEDCSEDSDDDKYYRSIQRPAFLVEGEPNFGSGPPEDGLEYLRRVRWEASHIPNVTVANVDRSKFKQEQSVYMPVIPAIAKCPEHLLPSKHWEDAFLADFSEFRQALSCSVGPIVQDLGSTQSDYILHEMIDSIIPNLIDHPSLLPVKDIDLEPPHKATTDTSVKESCSDYPFLSAILKMDSVFRVSSLRKRISLVESLTAMSRADGVWLFALSAAVETPLDADTCAAFRTLLRRCASLRAEKIELDDEVIMLNILATIAGRYFGQSEN